MHYEWVEENFPPRFRHLGSPNFAVHVRIAAVLIVIGWPNTSMLTQIEKVFFPICHVVVTVEATTIHFAVIKHLRFNRSSLRCTNAVE